MTSVKFAAVLMALAILTPTLSNATEDVMGRWGSDTSACEFGLGAKPFVVTSYAVRWAGDSCRIGRMYKTGDTVHIQAFCWGETGEHSVPVSLHPHAGKLSVTWDRGALGDMQRCP